MVLITILFQEKCYRIFLLIISQFPSSCTQFKRERSENLKFPVFWGWVVGLDKSTMRLNSKIQTYLKRRTEKTNARAPSKDIFYNFQKRGELGNQYNSHMSDKEARKNRNFKGRRWNPSESRKAAAGNKSPSPPGERVKSKITIHV